MAPDLAGCRVLVVEDEYLLADELSRELVAAGAEVVGPAATVAAALRLLGEGTPPHAAILDVNLGGEPVFPVADALLERGVPFVFCTGYDDWALPARHRGTPRCEKPVALDAIREVLPGGGRDSAVRAGPTPGTP